ncbi:MAG TPA: hypothetical protein ENK46_13115 [Flavobacteriia bacterium]|nr:hypothetical protein [Flavobacteriia bacterium]
MKKLANLKGATSLSLMQQKNIHGGGLKPSGGGACQVGCAGLSHGDSCFATGVSPNCTCPGICSGGVCNPY